MFALQTVAEILVKEVIEILYIVSTISREMCKRLNLTNFRMLK